jgi:hypothetical protein
VNLAEFAAALPANDIRPQDLLLELREAMRVLVSHGLTVRLIEYAIEGSSSAVTFLCFEGTIDQEIALNGLRAVPLADTPSWFPSRLLVTFKHATSDGLTILPGV